jgi:hypothetical protein
MVEVCGIIADIKREDQGVYVFPQLTLMGYDNNSPELNKLKDLGVNIGDENSRYEGVEVAKSSPFKLIRTMAKTFGFSAKEATAVEAPGGRTCITWTLMTDFAEECIGVVADIKREGEGEYIIPTCTIFGLEKEEEGQLESHGLKVGDANPRFDGVEITGSSPFKVMRILCKHFGWETDGKSIQVAAPGDRYTSIWQLTKKL